MQNFILYNNKKIYYQSAGQGDSIVLLHGFLNSSAVWNPYIEKLSNHYHIIAIDLPGHGESENIDEIHNMDLMADVVKIVLDELGIEKCVMIGHSMGGYVMLNFAATHQNRLAGFGLLNSSAIADNEEAKNNRLRTCEIVKNEKINFISSFIPNLFAPKNQSSLILEIEKLRVIAGNMTPQAIVAAQKGMMNRCSQLDLLATTKLPVLFISGKEDNRISQEILVSQAMMVNNAEILLLPTGHMAHIETPQEVMLIIENFAKRCFLLQNK